MTNRSIREGEAAVERYNNARDEVRDCRDKLLANPERTKVIVNEYISGQKATEKTEDELRTEWINDLNVMLMYILGIDEQLTSKYGYWQRW